MALNLGELFGTIGLDASEWDQKLAGAQDSLKTFGVAGAAVAGAAAVAIGAALTKGVVDSIDIEAGTDKVQASLGLTEAQAATAGTAAGNLFAQNYGDSMDDVNGAVEAVMSSISGMRDASNADVESMTAKMMNLSTVMGVDVSRAAQVAGQMITSGIATDGAHAADLLTASLQKVPANVREDILDAVDEYGPFMNSLGIKGEEAMGLLVTAADKGMYGIDKTGDAIKEFGIRATDMSASTRTAYEELGLSTDEMTGKLLEGGPAAKEAFGTIIHGLQEMEDPAAQSAAALALFGTPLEDLSVTEIPNFLGALDPMGDKFDSVAGAADKMGQDLTSNAKSGFDGFKRQAEAALIGFVQDNIMPSVGQFATFLNTTVGPAITQLGAWITNDALPAIRGFGDWFRDNLPVIQNWATGIGFLLIPLFLRIAISATTSAAAQVVAWATAGGGAIKAGAIYVAQSYIMIGRFIAMSAAAVAHGIAVGAVWTGQVIAGIVRAAVTYTVQAAMIIGRFVAMSAAAVAHGIVVGAVWTGQVVASAVSAAASFIVTAAQVVGGWALMGVQALFHAAKMAAAWFIALGPVGWVTAAVIGLVALIIANWDSVSRFTSEAWNNVSRFVSEAWNNIVSWVTSAGQNIINFLADTWRNVQNGVSAFINTAIALFLRFHPVGLIISNWSTITGFFSGLWSNVTSGISGFVSGVVGYFQGLPDQIIAALGNMGSLLLGAGGQIIDGFLSGLQSGFESVKNFVGGIGQWIADNKGPKAYDLKLLVPAGGWIMDGLEAGIKRSLPSLRDTLGDVSATIAAGVTGGSVGLTGTAYQPAAGVAGAGNVVTYAPTYQYLGEDPHEVMRRDKARAMDMLNAISPA